MKKIRIDYYNYRLKKGRADILLEKAGGVHEYAIPYHYVNKESRIDHMFPGHLIRDDGDLVIINDTLNECHVNKKGKEWIPLTRIRDVNITHNEMLLITHTIYSLFLDLCPREGESGLKRRVEEMLEDVKVANAKMQYVERLQQVLNGDRVDVFGALVKKPDPNLIRKEIETLKHFQVHKPSTIPMFLRDGMLQHYDLYTYERIDWEALGAEFQPCFFYQDENLSEE